MSTSISITHPKILKYFKEHKDINPETYFLLFIEILEKFGDNIFEKVTTSINTQILEGLQENTRLINGLQENINKFNNEITNSLFIKMMEIKKEYLEDMKIIISANTNERITTLMDKNNTQLIDKTNILLNEIIPKTNDGLFSQFNERINHFQKNIIEETERMSQKLSAENNQTNMKCYFDTFETNFNKILTSFQHNLQQPLHMYINTSEERINKNINNITDITKENMVTQTKLYGELNEFLNKYKIANFKGSYHENQLNVLLNNMFPSGEIVNTTGQKSSGDFMLKRTNKPNIMFENKDYTENVYNAEIVKFIVDIENIKSHGIFLSQHSGIAGKSNYQIDYHKGLILIYVHNVDYSREKIQLAVDIIDNLSSKLEEFGEEESLETHISRDVLESINTEYQEFALKKDSLIGMTKEYCKKSISQLEELKFPSLENYLSNHFASASKISSKLNNQYTCDICEKYICSTKKSLSAHKRGCCKQNAK
jgi:hypothetical protein